MLQELLNFFRARIKHALSDTGIRYDVIDALIHGEIGQLAKLAERAAVLDEQKDNSDFKQILEAVSRVMNIAGKCENPVTVNPALFENEYERALYETFSKVSASYAKTSDEKEHFSLLSSLQKDIENYFEHTMVMAEDAAVRNNRLSLMKEISDLAASFAAMNKIITA